jgi:hypothetical protein
VEQFGNDRRLRGTTLGSALLRKMRLVVSLCVALGPLLFGLACLERPDRDREVLRLTALREKRATHAEVVRELGQPFQTAERGTPSWQELEDSFNRAPSHWQEAKAKLPKYPKVLVYADDKWIVWIFLDAESTMQDYSLTGQ